MARLAEDWVETTNPVLLKSTKAREQLATLPWPCWWTNRLPFCHVDPNAKALIPMLRALRAASEAYSHDFDELEINISIPFWELPLSSTHRQKIIDTAAILAGTRASIGGYFFSGEGAAHANVDYSKGHLTTSLSGTVIGMADEVRTATDTTLGKASSDRSGAQYWTAVKDQIRRTSKLPSPEPLDPPNIASVVLYGDAIDDHQFLAILRDVLSEGGFTADALPTDPEMADPVFAAALGATSFWWPYNDHWLDENGRLPCSQTHDCLKAEL
ncbi:hypothetical protein LTR37_003184 [Vermiconidia calcicola]|uniref:Uncharacterized protein n=1 Tax=Vermiconidia calcicola TaxID=1690605 RepID=A0ACC3NQI9_9PEZI|nr:hypothetical protein LTR37_003184 [Vermiconidia calcicola]